MAFVPTTSFIPGTVNSPNWVKGHQRACKLPARIGTHGGKGASRKATIVAEGVSSKDAMEFFKNREGIWRSYRSTHHLAFRQSEAGESVIKMECLDNTDERVVQLCKDNNVEPERAQGGCRVTWKATMAWDGEGENHEGESIFALVPEEDDIRKGKMLRDRGYAEIVPIAGTYYMDEIDDLNLETPYEGGAVVERFSFDGPNYVNRLSTVKRFGGLSTATFATEERITDDGSRTVDADSSEKNGDSNKLSKEEILSLALNLPILAIPPEGSDEDDLSARQSPYKRSSRWGTTLSPKVGSQGVPPASSAFSSGFGTSSGTSTPASTGAKPPSTSAFATGFGATPKITSKPFAGSAFSTGFSGDRGQSSGVGEVESGAEGPSSSGGEATGTMSMGTDRPSGHNGNENAEKSTEEESLKITPEIVAAAKEIGIDLFKVPPSMRDGYVRSFYEDTNMKDGGGSS